MAAERTAGRLRRSGGTALLLVALLLAPACAGANRSAARDDGVRSRAVHVEVLNRGWSELVIHAVRSTNRVRLGQVGSLSQARFEIPAEFVSEGTLILTASPIGSHDSFESEPLAVSPGDVARLTVRPALAQSSVTLR